MRASGSSLLLAALAAAVAWFIAHTVLGHQQPFFAPIAAAITLSTTPVGRALRTAQLLGGVLLGIGVAEGLSAVIGTSTAALGVIVLVTLLAAVMSGVGLFAEGVLFANQAAVSAILVVTLHAHGTGPERALDAIVGGGVAFIFGVLLFPAEPMALVREAVRGVLQSLAETLQQAVRFLDSNTEPEAGWLRDRALHAHRRLEVLTRSCASARRIVRVAPRHWSRRALVAGEIDRLAQLNPLVDAVLGLARAAIADPGCDGFFPPALRRDIARLAAAMQRLAGTQLLWSKAVLKDVRADIDQVVADTAIEPTDHVRTARALLHAIAVDFDSLLDEKPSGPPRNDPVVARTAHPAFDPAFPAPGLATTGTTMPMHGSVGVHRFFSSSNVGASVSIEKVSLATPSAAHISVCLNLHRTPQLERGIRVSKSTVHTLASTP